MTEPRLSIESALLDFREGVVSLFEATDWIMEYTSRPVIFEIDKYIRNCEDALALGDHTKYGSAGGGMQLEAAKNAFNELRKFVSGLRDKY